ncbi:DUF5008 domain-containing protein [Mucilaginibacter sp. UR6-11]|uniref:DUF5008 domain-containing protein n=1 Tax=Mucilaginibacter sp. UR6-11 TaxID=1435644 RepID=UPI001E3E98BA|nr:DUF5008 domain-containing protein [Mucilaginibacter sp. UR6-11]MCC8424885.1 DUF5008 domain-containing protein [Mucilaginibacter sp. UR6-11]
MKLKYTGLLIVLAGLLVGGCKKNKQVFPDPYSGARSPLGIVTNPQQIPVPASGTAGTIVSISATGLLPYKDQLTFLFNGQPAKITEITATGIKVEVPSKASSGVTAFVVNGQLVFGPLFTVVGKVNLDPTYVNVAGTDGPVLKAFPIPLTTQLMIMGNFTNYNNQGRVVHINRLTRAFADGSWDRSFTPGAGANATVYDMAQVGPYYYIVGDFSAYAQQSGNVSRIAKINTNGLIDTVAVTTYLKKIKFVPTFNGGLTGTVRSIYPVGTSKMIVTGDFNFYTSRRYDQNTYDAKDSTIIDSVDVRQLVKLNDDGSIDPSWRFDPNAPGYRGRPGKSLPGANGPIRTLMQSDGKILVYGQFTTFDNAPANNILRLNADGSIDPTFNVGSGVDFGINFACYNAALNKYILVGPFSKYNGKASQYMVQINAADGSIDPTFTAKVFDGGIPTFAKLLNDGIAVINGGFKSYDGVIRNGFAVLDATGALKDGYNTIGNVSGNIYDIYETTSADNKRALLIMGSFYSFDNQVKNNIVRVTFE